MVFSGLQIYLKWGEFKLVLTELEEKDPEKYARMENEAISWGKNDKDIEDVMVWGEATVFFPLLISYIFNDIQKINRKAKELNNIFRAN